MAHRQGLGGNGDTPTGAPPAPRARPAGQHPSLHSPTVAGIAIAVAAPALVTAVGFVVDYRRVAFPVLLYLLGVVAAVALGRLVAGLVACVASGAGLAALLQTQHELAARSDPVIVLIVGLYGLVAVVFAYVLGASQTARRAAEEAERDLRFLIDGAGDTALFKLDEQGRVASWNAGAERLLGYGQDEAVGLEVAALVPEGESTAGIDAVLTDPLTRDEPYEEEGWRMRKDGSLLWASWTLTPMRDAEGVLTGFAHVIRDLTDHKRLEDDLSVLALQDSLTRLPNRALFQQHLTGALARVRRTRTVLALLFLDLDDFKGVNDTYGHAAGDELLVRVADRLRRAVRASDVVARLGGDEFTVLCEDVTDLKEAEAVARRVVEALAQPFDVQGDALPLAVSIGIAVAAGEPATPDSLLERADVAMYRAKSEGGARYRFWAEETDGATQAVPEGRTSTVDPADG